MMISDAEALRRARLAYPRVGEDWIAFATKLEQARAGIEQLEGWRAQLGKIHGGLIKIAAAGERLAKAGKAREQESSEARKRAREIGRLRAVLQKGAAFRKSASWTKLRFSHRWDIEEAEKAARRRLAKLEAEQKAARNRARFRSEVAALAAKSRRAMVERGVTFDRMV